VSVKISSEVVDLKAYHITGQPFQWTAGLALRYNDLLMTSRRAFGLAALAGLMGCRPRRGSGFPGYALVAAAEGRSIAAADLTAFALARRIPLDASPEQVVNGAQRATAYVLASAPGSVFRIDARQLRPAGRLRIPHQPLAMRLSPHRDALWLLAGGPAQLIRIDSERLQMAGRIPLPAEPAEFDLSPDGNLAAVTHPAGRVSIVDLAAMKLRVTAETGQSAGAVAFRPDGRLALVADPSRKTLAAVRVEDGRVLARLQLAMQPRRFRFKTDGGELFITGDGMDAVAIVNPYRTEVAETVLAGREPGAMAFSRSPEYLFITNAPTGDVTVLDPETRRVIAVTAVGEEPHFVAVTPDDGYALILNRRSGTLAVIRPASVVRSRQRGAPLYTTIPVGSRPVSLAVVEV
jgi:YVTN family beta-propeller protein